MAIKSVKLSDFSRAPVISYDFQDKGVRITVHKPPENKYVAQNVKIRVNPTPIPIEAFKSDDNIFTPYRIIIDFDLFDSKKEKDVSTFDAYISIRVAYTQDDLDTAEAENKTLSIAWWDGTNWIPFKVTQVAYGATTLWQLDGSEVVGELTAAGIFDADPPIALGS